MKNHLWFFMGEEMKNLKKLFAFLLRTENGSLQYKKAQYN